MAEATERRETNTETSKKVISNPLKEFKIVSFSGSVDDWPKQSKKFMAAGKLNKFAGLVDGSVTMPDLKENMDNKDLAIRELNQAAYCCLLYSMDEHISCNLVDTAKSKNLPDRDVALSWKNLLTRYESRQYGTLLELKRKFMTKSLQECENDPDILFLGLEESNKGLRAKRRAYKRQ